ncbi:porin [Fusobacterium necrophorum BFTR-1]|uniref:Porin n=6 Tax=Fusobacterium necrophorum TaxID=859 RepID=A0A017H3A6_9FUSO|nr:porin [Fusobacterium necrophorum subsp. funduliforme B35]KDE64692.1 porin [Fusobacterium necrophorum BL]KDE65874.1 porin [Fusobacterium necrophorum BFTR-1]KDE74432.1 porin [Fusobacterium necrophorum BFTR-2]KID49980.1 porin [Fusobacterium necrophorum subsp. funduliforme B35]
MYFKYGNGGIMKKYLGMTVLLASFVLAACGKTSNTSVRDLSTEGNQNFAIEDIDTAKKPLEDIIVFNQDGVTIRREGNNLILSMPELILFDFDKYEVKDGIKPSLRTLANALGANSDIKIKIDGYTDFIGSEGYNLELSVNRAKAIKSYLVNHGAIENNISIEGYGKQNPVASNATESGRARNRRVEFIISRS